MGSEGARPQVVAHRGASAAKAEHTLGAYITAIEQGAEALECDVRLTADGHLICVHDRDLRRTAYSPGLVSTKELAELNDLDFASWKNPWADLDDERPEEDPELGRVLTLRRLMEMVADHENPIEIAIETKHPTRYTGLVERRLVDLLEAFGWSGRGSRARVMSFSCLALRRVQRLAPGLAVVHLLDSPGDWWRALPISGRGWMAGPDIQLLRDHPGLAARLARSRELHVWTVNRAEDLDLCLELGASAVITDWPGYIVDQLNQRGV